MKSDNGSDHQSSGGDEKQSDFRQSLKIDLTGFWTDWMEDVRKLRGVKNEFKVFSLSDWKHGVVIHKRDGKSYG